MSKYTVCHKCGEQGHYARKCAAPPPQNAASALQATPPPVPAGWLDPSELRRPPEEIADYEKWGKIARAVLGMDDGPLIDTPFRHAMRIPPRTERQLREIAAAQVKESRGQYAMPGVDNQP